MSDDRVRIFVSSPSDVEHERAVVKDIVERLAAEYLPYFRLQAVLWEEEALTADRTFQAGLTQPEECEIVLVILWTRLGSPLPEEPYRGMTGTEWEFVNAVEASARAGTPEVLVYKKTAPKLVDITDAASAREAVEDRRRLDDFFRIHFFNEDNSFRRAFRTFDGDATFHELVEVQLRKLLNRRISAERRAFAGAMQWEGSPFRPERPFDVGDERVFTGREAEVRDLLSRLSARAAGQPGFLLLSGPSGSGKTSLLRAGVVPRLARPFLFERIATVRCALIDPRINPGIDPGTEPRFGPAGEAGAIPAAGNPLAALAAGLAAPDVLGEPLEELGVGRRELERLLATDPALAARQLAGALRRVARVSDADAQARLAIIVDPLQVVFEQAPAPALTAFAAALAGLAGDRAIWVIAAIRSDALHRLGALPALAPLTADGRWIDIEPPSAARIRQVVEIPARVAGIEIDAGQRGGGLVEHIEAEAARLRLWAPPVQQLLDDAYRAGAGDAGAPRLSAERVRERGGIRGEVLARADALWASLDAATRGALPRLCRALIGLEGSVGARPAPRRGDLRALRRDPAASRLLDALIDAHLVIAEGVRDPSLAIDCTRPDHRLFSLLRSALRHRRVPWLRRLRGITGRGGRLGGEIAAPDTDEAAADEPPAPASPPGQAPDPAASAEAPPAGTDRAGTAPDWADYRPVAAFAHPALISDWTPVRDWLARPEHRELLRLRSQLSRQARLWKRTDCNREYLYREAGYAEAQALVRACGDELEPLERDFLDHSAALLEFLRRRNRLVRGVGLMLLGLLLAASAAALLALHASREARVNLHRSTLKEAALHIRRGNTPQAVLLAIDAGQDLPKQAVQTLSLAFANNRLLAMGRAAGPGPEDPRQPAFNADGNLLATLVPGQGPRLWRLEQGRFVPDRDLQADGLGLHSLVIGDDQQVFGLGRRGVWRLPAPADAAPLYDCGSAPGALLALDPARRRLAVARNLSGDNGICVLDLTLPGKVLLDRELHEGEIRGLSFSPDGSKLLTASTLGRTHLIDLERGEIRLSLPAEGPLGRPFNNAVFDGAGDRIAIAAVDERVRLYEADGTPLGELSDSDIGGRRYPIHRTAVRDVAFAPGGAFLVAVDDEGQVVRWSLDGSDAAVVLGNHELSITELEIAPAPTPTLSGDTLVLTASLDRTARLWGLATGKAVAVLGHDGPVASARFGDDGRRVFTYSVDDGSVRLWSIQPHSGLSARLAHPDHVWGLDLSSAPPELAPDGDGLLLATAGFDGGVRVWRYERRPGGERRGEPEPLAAFHDHTDRVRQVRFSNSGRLLASAGYDGTAHVHDLVTDGSCKLQLQGDSGGDEVYNALFGPKAAWILTTSNDRRRPVRLFSPRGCQPIETGAESGDPLAHGGAPVEAAAVLAVDGATLVATGDDAGTLRVLEQADGHWRKRCELQLHIGSIGQIAPAPDGTLLGAAGRATRAALVAVDAGGCRVAGYLEGHAGRVYSIDAAPDGRHWLTGSLDATARLWRRDGTPTAVLEGHEDRIYRVQFSPDDGRWMLTASRDGSIRLWRAPQESPGGGLTRVTAFLPLRADLGGVADAAFSPDGHYIAGAYWENAALLWRLWTEEDKVPAARIERWGTDRARLSLIGEAYRFRADNQVVDTDAVEQAEEIP